jgi:hypothetical protein
MFRPTHEGVLAVQVRGSIYESYFVGGGLEYIVRPWPRFGFGFGAGGSSLLPINTPNGRVGGATLTGSIAAIGTAARSRHFRLDIAVAAHPSVLWTWAEAQPGFNGGKSVNVVVDATVGVRPAVRAGAIWVVFMVDAGSVFGGVRIRDSSETVARYARFVWGGGMGIATFLGRRFPIER